MMFRIRGLGLLVGFAFRMRLSPEPHHKICELCGAIGALTKPYTLSFEMLESLLLGAKSPVEDPPRIRC